MNFNKRVNGSWVDTPHYIHNTSTDTITTLPAVLYPNDTTATVGLKGNMEQNGTPTPDSPIMPESCGERTGNLFDKSTITTNAFAILAGTQENSNYYCSDFIPITAATYYFQNVTGSSVQNSVVVYDINKQGLRYKKVTGGVKVSGKLTFIEGDAYIRINCASTTDVDTVMVNLGSEALPYEPYGYKIPISSANTTTPVYLGEVQSTRRIRKLVLDGTEVWHRDDASGVFNLGILNSLSTSSQSGISSHWLFEKNRGVYTLLTEGHGCIRNSYNALWIRDNNFPTVADFKAYLQQQYAAGTPVTVWYVLAEPTTAIVNEPIRKIGDYADTVSGITIPTIAGANTISVGTTLQPSEVTVNYKGWHPVQSVHERESGAWT